MATGAPGGRTAALAARAARLTAAWPAAGPVPADTRVPLEVLAAGLASRSPGPAAAGVLAANRGYVTDRDPVRAGRGSL